MSATGRPSCPWVSPRWERRCDIEERHWHYPAWERLALIGDPLGRMMLLAWWPASGQRGVRPRRSIPVHSIDDACPH